jgi:putative ABC transport system permease protein
MAGSIANRRMRALPAVGFGLLAFALALVGMLGTLLRLVSERRRELAIRSALGASPDQLVRAIVGQGLALTTLGLMVGLSFGIAAARGLSVFLYRVSPYDTITLVCTVLLVGGGALVTAYLAALRVRGVDPLVVLRDE